MNIEFLLSFQDNEKLKNFSLNIIESENYNTWNKSLYKNDKNKYYKKIPVKKDLNITIVNKFNLILNKLSETNFNNIINEFIENINYLTFEEYEELQKTIYIKILSEINFIKIYFKFIELINYIYSNVLGYNLNYFINIINSKFHLDYLSIEILDINDKFYFINEINILESRINNIEMIKQLYKYDLINKIEFINYEKLLLNNSKFIADIYYWKPDMNEENILKLNEILNNDLCIRDKILIQNLIHNANKTELDYLLNDYLMENNNNIVKIIEYINLQCIDGISKINFCKSVIELYNENNNIILLDLIKKLLNEKIFNKIDLSNSLKIIKNKDIDKYFNLL